MRIFVLTLMISFLSHSAFGVDIYPGIHPPITITINEEPLDAFTQSTRSRHSFRRFACLFKRNRKIQPVIQTEINIEYRQLDHKNDHLIRGIVDTVKKLYFNDLLKIKSANSFDEDRLFEIEELRRESYDESQERCISVPPNCETFDCDNKSYMVIQEGRKKFRVYRDLPPISFSRLDEKQEFDKEEPSSWILDHLTSKTLPKVIKPKPRANL